MTNREYYQMTEVFVYLHGSDVCKDQTCKHCAFILGLWGEMPHPKQHRRRVARVT